VPEAGERANGASDAKPIQVQKFLGGIDYPTDKQTLLRTAEQQGASQAVLETLRRLPDQQYHSPNDVSEQISKLT
jgi:Protein of unknown function (DUF2795)